MSGNSLHTPFVVRVRLVYRQLQIAVHQARGHRKHRCNLGFHITAAAELEPINSTSCRRSLTTGAAIALTTSARSLFTIALGIFAGPRNPNHVYITMPDRRASARDGTSIAAAHAKPIRRAPLTPPSIVTNESP